MESMPQYRREVKLRFRGVGIEEIGEDGAAESGCGSRGGGEREVGLCHDRGGSDGDDSAAAAREELDRDSNQSVCDDEPMMILV
ncbi:hypothetical protein SASPL_109148 [Salvia splendens]|uniref:Uncharacterized protein n=1 Tax=Salvia splendens TaxID=180675 RepID=A0A8X8YK32_SALSN|nr:hypothetical protein SASPL_109148 [Salvia splendens]